MYLEKYNLSGRTAVITGGGRNIGLACAHALAEAGAHVVLAEIDPAVAASGQENLKNAGFDAETVDMDVTNPDQVTAAADALVAKHGVFWSCRAFGRHMLKRGSGVIVNVGSMSAFIVNKPQQQAFYNASKAGVHHLTKSLAAEWAERGVRVNAVAPTYIDTDLTRFGMEDEKLYPVWIEGTPMRRVGQIDEIGSVVLFLASDASSLMTGSIVLADAGYTCW